MSHIRLTRRQVLSGTLGAALSAKAAGAIPQGKAATQSSALSQTPKLTPGMKVGMFYKSSHKWVKSLSFSAALLLFMRSSADLTEEQ